MKRLNLKAAPPPRKRHLDRHDYKPRPSQGRVQMEAEMRTAMESAVLLVFGRFQRRLNEQLFYCRIVQFQNAGTVFEIRVANNDERVARLDELFFTADPPCPWQVTDAVAMELQLLFDCQIVEVE